MAYTATDTEHDLDIILQPTRTQEPISDAGANETALAVIECDILQASASCPRPRPSSATDARDCAGSWNLLSAAQHALQCTGSTAARDGARPSSKRRDDNPSDAMQRGTKRNFDSYNMYADARMRGMLKEDCNAHSEHERQYDVLPLEPILRCFAWGWLPPATYNMLYEAVKTLAPTGSHMVVSSLVSFERSLLLYGSTPTTSWNMSQRFAKLAAVRRKRGEDFAELSELDISDCVWDYSNNFILESDQQDWPSRKKRSIINHMLRQTLGGQRRVRALLRLGWSTFANVNDESDMLRAFLRFIVQIEEEVASATDCRW